MSIQNDETIKKIILYTIIPYPFPFTDKWITLLTKEDKIPVHVYLKTLRRFDILNLFFSTIPSLKAFAFGNQLPTFDSSKFKWMPNDRFGQVNYMMVTFYFDVREKKLNDVKKEIKKTFLPLCVESIKRISTGYRLLTDTYFPRNFTKNDIIAYRLGFILKNKNNYYEEKEAYSNVDFQDFYSDENLRIDISDFLRYDKNIRISTELMINAEDFFAEDNYRMSVIEANIAVETILFNIVEKHYSTYPQDLQKDVSLNDLPELRISNLNKYLNFISPKIRCGKRWSEWKSKCQDLRNEVVHKRKEPSLNEANKALSSAKELIEFLKDFLYDEEDWILEATAFINDREKAKLYLNKSILVKAHPDAYYYLGHIECEAKNYDVAIQYFRDGLKLINDPFFKPHFYFFMGKCYEDQRLYSEALKEYGESIKLIEQADKKRRNFLIRHPYNNPYYRKYVILTTHNLKYNSNDIINLFITLLEVFPRNSKLQKLRDDFSRSAFVRKNYDK